MDNPLVQLFKESGMSIKDFAAKADVPYSSTHDIISGKTKMENIGAGAFVRMAKVLGTTADALMGTVDESDTPLSPAEAELVSLFRRMGVRERELLMDNARAFAQLSGSGVGRDERVAERALI